jgi:hypothetical protein
LPGTYTTASGESFPLVVPEGTSLVGDEPNKGAGAVATKIASDFDGGAYPFQMVVDPKAGSTLAGFTLTVTGGETVAAVSVTSDHVTIRNNSFVDNVASNALRFEGANYGVVRGNVLKGTSNGGFSAALIFRPNSSGNVVEGNLFTANEFGLELDSPENVDFGGGDAGSAGNNELRCNTKNDVWTNEQNFAFFGQNNRWDHFPPTTGTAEDGTDIRKPAGPTGATFYVDGGSVSDAACP